MDVGAWRARIAGHRESMAALDAQGVAASQAAPTIVPPFVVDPNIQAAREASEEARALIGRGLLDHAMQEIIASGGLVTDVGLQAVCSDYLSRFFALGFELATRPVPGFDVEPFKALLQEVLADRFGSFRFRRGAEEPLLASMSEAQKIEWMTPRSYNSVWLAPESHGVFHERLTKAADIGRTILGDVAALLGPLSAVEQAYAAKVAALRQLDKSDPAWITGGQEAGAWASKVNLLRALGDVARLDVGIRDPKAVDKLRSLLTRANNGLSREQRAALGAALSTEGLRYQSGQTFEDPPAALRFALSAISCLQWPHPAVLSECTDANKHLIYTTTDDNAVVSGTLRVVERMQGARKSGPMLVLERIYPDLALEGKRRIIEHAYERAAALRMPLLLPKEYFWSCEEWERVAPEGKVRIPGMDAAIEALAAKTGARLVEPIKIRVKAPMGPFGVEYIDSAPLGGAATMGAAQDRTYRSADTHYDNMFVVLLPPRPARRDP